MGILEIICVVILIEATTNILSKSELFKPLREFLFNRRKRKFFDFIHELVDCPYCLSVWVSLFYVFMLYLYLKGVLSGVCTWFFMVIIFHRLSNILHFIIDRVRGLYNEDLLG